MIVVPLQSVPSQLVSIILNGQNTGLAIYQKDQGLFIDVTSNGTLLVSAVICRNAVPVVCRNYLGFDGNLLFIDTQGESGPEYSGLGSRYNLVYLTGDEYAVIR